MLNIIQNILSLKLKEKKLLSIVFGWQGTERAWDVAQVAELMSPNDYDYQF